MYSHDKASVFVRLDRSLLFYLIRYNFNGHGILSIAVVQDLNR
jgi:hypothetical protein